jgi:hypothetical protein
MSRPGFRPLLVVLALACGKSSSAPDAQGDSAAGSFSPAVLTSDRSSVDLSTPVGCPTPALAKVHITNAGEMVSGPLAVTVTPPFVLGADGCQGQVLAFGNGCDIEVRFVPTAVGPVTGALTIVANPGGQRTVTLKGQASNKEAPMFERSALDFGSAFVGATSLSRMVKLLNPGFVPSPPILTSLAGADFMIVADTCNHAVIAPAQSCSVELVFRPTSIGVKQGSIAVEITDACGPSRGVANLTGTALLPPDAGASD